jgi:hypothetical protein
MSSTESRDKSRSPPWAPRFQHHPAEREQIVGRGNALIAGAGLERARPREKVGASLIENADLAGHEIGLVAGRDAVELRVGHGEAGVFHAQRLEDSLAHEAR